MYDNIKRFLARYLLSLHAVYVGVTGRSVISAYKNVKDGLVQIGDLVYYGPNASLYQPDTPVSLDRLSLYKVYMPCLPREHNIWRVTSMDYGIIGIVNVSTEYREGLISNKFLHCFIYAHHLIKFDETHEAMLVLGGKVIF